MKNAIELREVEPAILFPSGKNFVYSLPLKGDLAREVYQEGQERVAREFKDTQAFKAYRTFNQDAGEIIGSNTFWGIIDDKVLGRKGAYLPGLREGRALDNLGKLVKGVYSDYGLIVYSELGCNEDIAELLVSEAKKRNLELPLVVPFRAVDLRKGDTKYGTEIYFVDEPQGIISGEEAREEIQKLSYKADDSVRRLYRNSDGDWDGGWDILGGSNGFGRVGRYCAEGTRENLEPLLESGIKKVYDGRIENLDKKIEMLNEEKSSLISQKEKAGKSAEELFGGKK